MPLRIAVCGDVSPMPVDAVAQVAYAGRMGAPMPADWADGLTRGPGTSGSFGKRGKRR